MNMIKPLCIIKVTLYNEVSFVKIENYISYHEHELKKYF